MAAVRRWCTIQAGCNPEAGVWLEKEVAMKKLGGILFLLAWADAGATVFNVDSANSSATFEVGYFAHGMVKGILNRISGRVDLDGNTKIGSGDIIFDMTAVETGSSMTNRFIKSGSIFDSARFPTMQFHATRFDFDGERLLAVNGDLQLHGVTKAIRLEAKQFACIDAVAPDGPVQPCHGEFSTVIYRSHFGMNHFRLLVDDEVLINVSLGLERVAP